MDQQAQQLIDRIKQAQNVLVTVSVNPSVDQLAAAIGLTIALNKFDKHGTAVFSGRVPSTIEFLKPESTLEKNTDSLRDFIIALDKSKADKLRYKVEDDVVRIFITPYKTSLSQKDLDFSQGDFNVDVVVALGVTQQQDIDAAITAHGRILHDATVASVSLTGQGDLGTINCADPSANSLSEMMLSLIDGLDKKLLDNQIATALLTGIVASTDRFRNEKTSPRTMSISAELMAAGANPQLIASELETLPPSDPSPPDEPAEPSDQVEAETVPSTSGELDIDHDDDDGSDIEASVEEEPEAPEPPPQIHVDKDGTLSAVQPTPPELPEISQVHGVTPDGKADELDAPEVRHERLSQPPTLGEASLTANTAPEGLEPAPEELTLPPVSAPLLTHNEAVLPPALGGQPVPSGSPFIPQTPFQPPPPDWVPPDSTATAPPAPVLPLPDLPAPSVPVPVFDPVPAPVSVRPAPPVSPASASLRPDETLTEIEQAVRSPHLQSAQSDDRNVSSSAASGVDDARDAVQAAFNNGSALNAPLQPIAALNAQPLGPDLHAAPISPPPSNTGFSEPTPGNTPADAALDMPLPSNPFGPGQQAPPPSSFPAASLPFGVPSDGQAPPPPVPPPMLPPLQ